MNGWWTGDHLRIEWTERPTQPPLKTLSKDGLTVVVNGYFVFISSLPPLAQLRFNRACYAMSKKLEMHIVISLATLEI